MSNKIADIYANEIVRAVLGPRAHAGKVDNPERVRQIAEHLADSELAQSALQAKGYGRRGESFLALTRDIPNYSPGALARLFAPRTLVGHPVLRQP